MDDKTLFKLGFLLRCADEGLLPDAVLARVKMARSKRALSLGDVVGPLTTAGLVTGIGLPVAGGAGIGYGLAKATEPGQEDVEEAKQNEIAGEYYRLADEARRNAKRKRVQDALTSRPALRAPSPLGHFS